MGRLIDENALWMDVIHSLDYCDDILEIIERQPTIEERKKGKWIDLWDRYRCSACNMEHFYEENFCPNCGAEMIGVEDGGISNG